MAKSKDPAFLFYSQDFLVGTMTMTYEQRGKYITLLCMQHDKKDVLTQEEIDFVLPNHNEKVLSKFIKKGKTYYNKRLMKEMDKRKEHSQKQRENAYKRWGNQEKDGMQSQCDGNANAVPLEDEDVIENKNVSKTVKKKKVFKAPTLKQVQEYCKERKNSVDPKKFYDYFTVSNWVDSKGAKVKNWKQKIISWENNGSNNSSKSKGKVKNDVEVDWLDKYI